jgi:microcystin-dependent protein
VWRVAGAPVPIEDGLGGNDEELMSTPFLSEIRIVTWNFAAKGWAFTNGQTLSINQNAALFSLLGITYGGDGKTTFMLPNLQSRIPMHMGQGSGLSARAQGAFGGIEGITPQDIAIPPGPAPTTTAYIGPQGRFATISPFAVLNFLIALQGIFPSQS